MPATHRKRTSPSAKDALASAPFLLHVEDIRRALGCGSGTSYRLAQLLGKRTGKAYVVAKSELISWLLSGEPLPALRPKQPRHPRPPRQPRKPVAHWSDPDASKEDAS